MEIFYPWHLVSLFVSVVDVQLYVFAFVIILVFFLLSIFLQGGTERTI